MTDQQLPPERPYPLDHEGRIARLEGIVEQIDIRLGRLETKMDTLETKMDALNAKIDANLRWIIALQVATWGLIGALKLFG